MPIAVVQLGVGFFEDLLQGGGLVRLAWREMEAERMSVAVAKEVEFCRKTPTRTA